MNRVMLIGRLTGKPELRYTGSNLPFARFSLAVNRNFSNAKGSLVSIEGRIQTGSYDDKDGNKRYTTDVVADSVQFLESKSQNQNRVSNSNSNDASPYDYQNDFNGVSSPMNDINVDNDPFADFGDSVSIDDNFLD